MATAIEFNEGMQHQAVNGWPANFKLHLSTRKVADGDFAAGNTYGGGFGEITGTGYAAQSVARPAPTGIGSLAFALASFTTGVATDWPAAVKSVVVTDSGNARVYFAKDLSTTRDMSAANTTLNETLTYTRAQPA